MNSNGGIEGFRRGLPRPVRGWALVLALCVVGGASVRGATDAQDASRQWSLSDATKARKTYETMLASQPGDARLAFNAGVAAHAMGDWEAAARHHEAALSSEDIGLQQRAFFGLGNARFRQGEASQDPAEKTRLWEDAARQYQAAMGLNAADTDARANLETVREQLTRLQRQQSKQPDSKDPKDSKDKQDSKDQQDKQDKQDSQEKQDSNDSRQKQDPGKDSKDSKNGKEGPKGKDESGKDSKDGSSGDRGDKDDGRMQPQDKEGSKDGQGKKEGQDGKDGKDGKKGKDGKGTSGQETAGEERGQREGEAGQAAQGAQGGPNGEDSAEGRMAVRFAERLLDAHKREEKALIWSTPKARDDRRNNSGRKTW
jgi:hypothetical protein